MRTGIKDPRTLVRIAIDDLQEFQDSYCALMLTGALGLARSDLAPGDRTDVNVRVGRLHRLQASVVTMPYLMQLLNAIVDQSVAVKDGLACLDVVEAFLVRRAIMGSTASLKRCFCASLQQAPQPRYAQKAGGACSGKPGLRTAASAG